MSAIEERKRRIAQLVDWARSFLKDEFDSHFANYHPGGVYTVYEQDGKKITYPSMYHNSMLFMAVREAQKRWMVSDGTARDYARMAIRTVEDELARKGNALSDKWKD